MNYRVKAFSVMLVLFSLIHAVTAQNIKTSLFLESGVFAGAGENITFHTLSNRNGILRNEKSGILLKSGFYGASDTSRVISLMYGADAVYRYDSNSRLWVQQGYVKIIASFVVLQAGLIEEDFGNQDADLSSGGYLFSHNARPVPKISLLTADYVTIPFTGNLLELNAGISHGWFGDRDQYVKDAFLHHKYAFLRIGELKWRVSFNIGLQHAAMWGGVSPLNGKLPSDMRAFRSVFLAKMGDNLGPLPDQINVLGNHLGSYSLGLKYKLENFYLGFYWQTFLEDKNGRVGVDWKNKGDGLWGLTLSGRGNEGITKVLFEFFNSTSQSGDPSQSGNDNYFNNYLYRSGWTMYEMTIGSPLITSPVLTNSTPDSINYIENNSVRAFIGGVKYVHNENELTAKVIYSLNYGTISVPYTSVRNQLSAGIRYTWPSERFRDVILSCEAAFDIGSHLGNNTGLFLSARKTF